MISADTEVLDRKSQPLPIRRLTALWPLDGWHRMEPLRGAKNEHFRLETTTSTYFLRRSHRNKSRDELRQQFHLLRFLAEHGLRVPLAVSNVEGHDHAVIDDRLWTVTKLLDGQPYDGSPGQLAAFGRSVANYHLIVADLPAVCVEPPLVAELRNRVSGSTLDEALQNRATRVLDDFSALLPDLPRVIVHGGARRGSLLFRDDEVVSVLDFDSAHADVRVLDLAVAAHDVGKIYTSAGAADHKVALDVAQVAQFLDAYRPVITPTAAELEAIPLIMEMKRLKRALGRLQKSASDEPMSDNDHAKIRLEYERLRWLEAHRSQLALAWRT